MVIYNLHNTIIQYYYIILLVHLAVMSAMLALADISLKMDTV